MITSPAFMFYASDRMADKQYRLMTLAERGLYISMLCECWVNNSLPSKPDELAQWLGYSTDEIRITLTSRVMSFFKEINGELISPEIERYRESVLVKRDNLAKAGSKGGKKTAQSRQGNFHANGSHHPSPTSSHAASDAQAPREEMSREEKNRKESLGIADTSINDPWVEDYEKASKEF